MIEDLQSILLSMQIHEEEKEEEIGKEKDEKEEKEEVKKEAKKIIGLKGVKKASLFEVHNKLQRDSSVPKSHKKALKKVWKHVPLGLFQWSVRKYSRPKIS